MLLQYVNDKCNLYTLYVMVLDSIYSMPFPHCAGDFVLTNHHYYIEKLFGEAEALGQFRFWYMGRHGKQLGMGKWGRDKHLTWMFQLNGKQVKLTFKLPLCGFQFNTLK